MSTNFLEMTPALLEYLQKNSVREAPELKALRERTQTVVGAHIQSSPESAQFLAFLVGLMNAQKVLEIGTFTGYATLAMALAQDEHGKVMTCEMRPAFPAIGEPYWKAAGVAHKIDLRLAKALDLLDTLLLTEADTFDFIFVDADKSNYLIYFEKSLALLRRGGLMVIDNVLWSGRVIDPSEQGAKTKAIRELNSRLLVDDRVSLSMVPIGDGMSLLRKR